MVKTLKKDSRKNRHSKGFKRTGSSPSKITASTAYGTCTELLSPFGGILALIKFLDLIQFKEIFDHAYKGPKRQPNLGHYRMVVGILMLLFIGFNRLWHFVYVRVDAMLCGFFQTTRLPAASTFWRYVDSLGLNQANSLLNVMAVMRERVWQQCGYKYRRIHVSLDTTVETVYGDQQGARKGHNTQHRGKKGYRPVLGFIDEPREYLLGKLRRGETLNGDDTAAFIRRISNYLPGCVKKVLVRADGEFFSRQSVEAAMAEGFDFIIANKTASPDFDPTSWYRPWKRKGIEYNTCMYQPFGWENPCRFVAMRIPKESDSPPNGPLQYELFDDDRYTYRIFCTNLLAKPHEVIGKYDKRADVENLIAEAKREGVDAIPSAKFKNNYAYFQIFMLAYNIWRYFKMMAQQSLKNPKAPDPGSTEILYKGITNNTIRIARLKLLFIAAKVVSHGNRDQIKYSIHDARMPIMHRFLKFLDTSRARARPWAQGAMWPCRFSLNCR
jgi:hypothetical protein